MISDEFKQIFDTSITPEGKSLVFITFSRFECALKNSIRFANPVYNKVIANWENFTSSISDTFNRNQSPELNNAVEYLLNNPPKIQQLRHNQLIWCNRIISDNTPLTTILGLHIKTIRNNLFHGGKFNGIYEQDISRNYILINSAMIILNEWLRLNQEIKNLFLEHIT